MLLRSFEAKAFARVCVCVMQGGVVDLQAALYLALMQGKRNMSAEVQM